MKPFVGVDGEGSGVDEHGRQQYRLLRAGEYELYADGAPLTTIDCLEFLTGLDADAAIYVGFFFDYDTTMILRDLNKERRARLFNERKFDQGISPYTDYRQFQVDYMPRKYLRVRRRTDEGWSRAITINDTGGFFQCSFVQALTDWNIGTPAQRAAIQAMKDQRDQFAEIDQRERDYNRQECELLAELMEALRAACVSVGYVPHNWQGAGYLASAMLKHHKVIKRKDVTLAPNIAVLANDAYYGGRFETTAVGQIPGPVWEYDISSAYPAAMLTVPCLRHGRWIEGRNDQARVSISHVRFQHPDPEQRLCGLPLRQRSGVLCWPREGEGVYWSPELKAARRAGAHTRWLGGAWFDERCECQPFHWLPEVFAERKRLGKAQKGKPLKLGMNAMYGKTAQSIGSAPWGHRIWAGWITALTRSWLMDVYREAPSAVIMLATDALYSTRPLAVKQGAALGDWEAAEHDGGMFIVQPGLYWMGSKQPKTRGVPRSRVIEHQHKFVTAWHHYAAHPAGPPPRIPIPLTAFIGLRLANARNKPELAGCWLPTEKSISFDWSSKREGAEYRGDAAYTMPIAGGHDWVSVPYKPKSAAELEQARWELEAMPDYVEPLEIGE